MIDAQGFPYPTVAAAMEALLDNRDAELTVKAGWTLFEESVDGLPVQWSFTPSLHPAHPSAVRRAPLVQDGAVRVSLSYRCEAKPEACEGLLEEFRQANAQAVVDIKRRLGHFDHARQAEAVEFAERYLDLMEGGKDDETLGMLTSYSRSGYTPVEWRRIMGEQRRKQGALGLRRLQSVFLFDNPPDAKLQGTLAFLEFQAIYENHGHSTIKLVLHAEKDAPFRLMRDEPPNLRVITRPK